MSEDLALLSYLIPPASLFGITCKRMSHQELQRKYINLLKLMFNEASMWTLLIPLDVGGKPQAPLSLSSEADLLTGV